MARKRSIGLVAVAVGAIVATLGAFGASAASPVEADATAVTQWNLIAASTLGGLPGPAGGAPPASQISMGMVQGAVYDAVNAITPKHHRPYLLERRFGNTASGEAAVATAAYLVLKNIVETVPQTITFPTRATVLASLQAQYVASTDAIADSPFKAEGIAAGTAAAEAMIDARKDDGRFGPSQFVANATVGYWDPVAPNGTTALDPTAWVGGVAPFLLHSSSQFRSAGPYALGSAAYAADVNEVKAIGGDGVVTPSTRDANQTYIAKWWQSNPMVSWNGVARQLIARNHLDIADSARLLAMENLAAADAAINTWNNKYHFSFWRPFQAIRRAADDGNSATSPDPTWTPLISAPYPEYTSGHMGLDGSHVTALRAFFGDAPDGGYEITSSFVNPGGSASRSFTSFSQAVNEIVEARIWAGLHFRDADVQGLQLGIDVANFAAENYFASVGDH
jgi:PAP2 superfamily